MNNLIKFISKYYVFIVFLFLELLASFIIIQNNRYHRASFLNSANDLTGSVYSLSKSISIYFSLKENNLKLVNENALLKNSFKSFEYTLIPQLIKDSLNIDTLIIDTINNYSYLPALAISNSISKKYNYIYLDKGLQDGFHKNMGAVEANGLVGIVINCNKNYSVVMPLTNEKSKISVKIKHKGYFGTLQWQKGSIQTAKINEIPNHANISIGDTVISSGYSQIFPEGILVGLVTETKKIKGQSSLDIDIRFSVDFSKINYIYGIKNKTIETFKELRIE